ncbi:MAG: hypothetical protein KF847_18225 [Pirellulales bacterium]|nr:hypothetical protein [Pirellulales bacterium]
MAALAVAIVAMNSGCKEETSVSGEVTYNGEPVGFGYVTFHAQGGGRSFSASIASGSYQATEAMPGKYRAIVTGSRRINHYSSSADAYANAPKAGQHVSESTSYIEPEATGNSQECEVVGGKQTIDFKVVDESRPKPKES